MKTLSNPQIKYLDGYRYQSIILSGCREIIKHENELNELNVFPIPDKDTGANLKKTLKILLTSYPVQEARIDLVSRAMADLALQSAMGYSGIIFSQILLALAEGLNNRHRIYTSDLNAILPNVLEKARQSVEHPVEGTILSVLKEWSEEIFRISSEIRDFVPLLEISRKRALSALASTPDQLEILKKNRVVDAGGKAFVYFLDGILNFVQQGKLQRVSATKKIPHAQATQQSTMAPFCVECCIKADNLRRKDLAKSLNDFGQDLIFYGAPNFAKFHINTQDPEGVLTCASSFGEIGSKKIFRLSSDLTDEEKKSFCLVADSTCDLTEDLIEHNPMYFVPIKVQAGEETYTDRLDIIPEEFYKIMDEAPSVPKTSQPSLNEFVRIYKHLLMHYGSIISVHLSRALSGTFQTAVQASQSEGPERISVIDGNNISVGLGLVLLEGFRAIESGKDREKTAHRIAIASRNTQIFVGLPTLKFLVMGGRVTKTKGTIANILNINPILSINEEGKLIPVSKARGAKNLENKILDLVCQKKQNKAGGFSIAVAHTNAPEIGGRISDRIKRIFAIKDVMVMNASPVLGAHAGPGAYGIAIHIHSFTSFDNNRNT